MNRRMTLNEAADLIQRYLDDKSLYRQEWNDFVDTSQKLPETEKLRVICDVDFQALLEHQGEISAQTLREMQRIVDLIREKDDISSWEPQSY